MQPLLPEIVARWAKMWGPDVHPTRSWWRRGQFSTWERVDGAQVDDGGTQRFGRATRYDPKKAKPHAVVEAELAAYDAAHPLPAPPPMPGQVWCWGPANAETAIAHVYTGKGRVLWATGGETGPENWPPQYAVLVDGPTPWGRGVPWSPP